ncbi:unnamed protein product [Closterium sp. NIES-53]
MALAAHLLSSSSIACPRALASIARLPRACLPHLILPQSYLPHTARPRSTAAARPAAGRSERPRGVATMATSPSNAEMGGSSEEGEQRGTVGSGGEFWGSVSRSGGEQWGAEVSSGAVYREATRKVLLPPLFRLPSPPPYSTRPLTHPPPTVFISLPPLASRRCVLCEGKGLPPSPFLPLPPSFPHTLSPSPLPSLIPCHHRPFLPSYPVAIAPSFPHTLSPSPLPSLIPCRHRPFLPSLPCSAPLASGRCVPCEGKGLLPLPADRIATLLHQVGGATPGGRCYTRWAVLHQVGGATIATAEIDTTSFLPRSCYYGVHDPGVD